MKHKQTEYYSTNIDFLVSKKLLDVRVGNCLLGENITDLKELSYWTKSKLEKINNLGKKSIKEVLTLLSMCKVKLKEEELTPRLKKQIVRRNKQTEYQLHLAFWKWCCFAIGIETRYVFAIEHGEIRNPATGAKLKRKGVKPGMADYMIMIPSRKYNSLWIEFKCGKNKQTSAQVEFQQIVYETGGKYVVCRSLAEAITVVTEYVEDVVK